jgi:hypothetical protein
MKGRDVYLVGSVPMASSSDVFREVSAALGPRLRWLPDGETGDRLDWVAGLEGLFANHPAFEPSGKVFRIHPTAPGKMRRVLKAGFKPEDIDFGNLGYADHAIASYGEFARQQAAGGIPARVKFQVDLVPAHSVLWLFVEDELHAALDPVYNNAVKRELARIAAAIPHDKLAMQFDVASAVFARLERNEQSPYGRDRTEATDKFARILVDFGDHVPADVDLLYHFCYGDSNHRHVVEPTDMGDMVALANRIDAALSRPVQLYHMPVPRNRFDDAYFAPLKDLRVRAGTDICLGLVHHTDGADGTLRRMATARKHLANFLVGTECGFGRRAPDTIPRLLKIHAAAADAP